MQMLRSASARSQRLVSKIQQVLLADPSESADRGCAVGMASGRATRLLGVPAHDAAQAVHQALLGALDGVLEHLSHRQLVCSRHDMLGTKLVMSTLLAHHWLIACSVSQSGHTCM